MDGTWSGSINTPNGAFEQSFTFKADGDTTGLVKRLYEEGVVVRDVPGQGWIRVSCGWWTSEDDLGRLVQALGS